MLRRLLPAALLAALIAAPTAQAERSSTGTSELRVRDGHAVVTRDDGSWRVWDLRKGRRGPLHHLRCGASRLVDWGRDAGEGGSTYVAVTLERVEVPTDEQGNPIGLPQPAQTGPDDALCRTVRAVLDRDGDGRSDPGAVAVLRLTDLGRAAVALPLLRLPAGDVPAGLWVLGDDVWLALEGGARYIRLAARATAWGSRIDAGRRPAAVDPAGVAGMRLLEDGALWRWTWADLARRGTLRVSKGGRLVRTRRPRTTFRVANPSRGWKPQEKGACRSPSRLEVGGPAVAIVDARGRGGWGVSDGAGTWRCGKKPENVFAKLDFAHLMRTADGGRSWRLSGRLPAGATLVGLLGGQPVFEHGVSGCDRRLVVRRGRALREIACRG